MKRLIASFRYAGQGLRTVFRSETNFRIHLAASLMVIILGYILKIATLEWVAISLSIGLVISMECLNSAVEYLADFVSPEKNEQIKKVKDAAAAAVLISALASIGVGLLIFAPKMWSIVKLYL
ncbi:diacylglycerol kinase [Sphingobacterium chungjuense]|uniref:diacylglycerol kinase n=1 Tax=Sphingobacterium chungjuense TaxID=2675553 RepID=UPI00140A33A5|nr:diacylglycerol kinase family protein [Sphingobacterium chungjuense]